jgi:hypothetical protein
MQLHALLEIFALHVFERPDFDDARVIDQNVDLAKALESLLDSRLNLRAIEQVAGGREHVTAAGRELGFGTREFVRVTGQNGNASALFANLARNRQAKSARTSGDQHDFVSEREARGLEKPGDQPKSDEQSAGEKDYAKNHPNEASTFNPPAQGYGATGAQRPS